ncbi:MAG TPA: hypothetical protein VNQ34_04000 [Xanthobacteraceae bacterium]|nr:hypothetical protein [Xanthobacteraceae bacterium]
MDRNVDSTSDDVPLEIYGGAYVLSRSMPPMDREAIRLAHHNERFLCGSKSARKENCAQNKNGNDIRTALESVMLHTEVPAQNAVQEFFVVIRVELFMREVKLAPV